MKKKILALILSLCLAVPASITSYASNLDTDDIIEDVQESEQDDNEETEEPIINPDDVQEDGVWKYKYTGSVQEFTAPQTGKYLLDVYGADGGRSDQSAYNSGIGGRSEGYINLREGETLYIYVGQSGSMGGGATFNGGGAGTGGSGSGGGATDIRRQKATGSWYNEGHTSFANDTSLQSRIIVAGGGGGESSNRGGNAYAGSGGGAIGQSVRYYENFSQYVAYGGTQASGYEFGKGENADSSIIASNGGTSGGGGGGYYGGGASSLGDHGAAGGSGYVGAVTEGETFSCYLDDNGRADGFAKITYIGPVISKLTLVKGNVGTWTYGSEQIKIIEGEIGTTISIPSVAMTDSYTTFKGWMLDGTEDFYKTWTFGMDDATLRSVVITPLTLKSTLNVKDSPMMFDGKGRTHLNWAESSGSSGGLTYELFQSKDGTNFTKLMANGYPETANISTNFRYTGSAQTVVVKSNGWYTLRVVGGKGGYDIGTGGAGGSAWGTFYLKKGDVLYAYIGGAGENAAGHTGGQPGGWNGGGRSGASGWSGTGGGGSDIRLNSTDISARILVAGGGGGASNGSFSGAAANTGTHTSTLFYGGNVGGGDGGGGGGGYYGGYAGNDSSRGGGGGSNFISTYVNGARTLSTGSVSSANGSGAGSGVLSMANTETTITGHDLDLYTPDEAKPNAPDINSFETIDADAKTEVWQFTVPEDNGTTYWHYVRIKGATTDKSNVTKDTVTSGIKGYYYYIDSNPTGSVSVSNTYTTSNKITVNWTSGKTYYQSRYLHIAAIDNAGNLGPTTVYGMNIKDSNLRYDIYTNQIKISTGSNVYKDPTRDKTYFVKSNTDFNLNYDGLTSPYARLNYMVNMMYFESDHQSLNQSLSVRVGNSQNEHPSPSVKNTGASLLAYTTQSLTRSNELTKLNYKQNFKLTDDVDNKLINVVPKAEVYFTFRNNDLSKSSRDNVDNNDFKNNIGLICDSKEPTISCDEKYDPSSPNYYPLIEEKTIIPIYYADYVRNVSVANPQYGSGVTATDTNKVIVTLTQEQTDNGGPELVQTYNYNTASDVVKITQQDAYKGVINLTIDPKKYSDMSGFVRVDVKIIDNVGNVATKQYRLLIMRLDATLKNVNTIASRYDGSVFAPGEQGQIILETNGFIDKLEATFPAELDELAKVERTTNGTYDDTTSESNVYTDIGRVLSDTYPRDKDGIVTTVLPAFQTKLWGTTHPGGMQYNSTISNYENCYLHHFFYAPTYAVHKRYDVVVTAYKTDINGNGKTYSVTKTLPLYIGITPSGNDIGDITTEFNDVIEDN